MKTKSSRKVMPTLKKHKKGEIKSIPLFQYNSAVESHKNTLNLLQTIQKENKKLEEELQKANKRIKQLEKDIKEMAKYY